MAEPDRRLIDPATARGVATPTTLAKDLPFSRRAVSQHLAVLLDAGVVAQRRSSREVRYTVWPERLEAAERAMTAAGWEAWLQAIKRLAGPRTGTTTH